MRHAITRIALLDLVSGQADPLVEQIPLFEVGNWGRILLVFEIVVCLADDYSFLFKFTQLLIRSFEGN